MFSLSRAFRRAAMCDRQSIKRMSSVKVSVDEHGISLVELNRPPVNSLGLEFMQDIIASLDQVEKESKGLILTSTSKSVFCAGLDLTEMYKPDEARLREFWSTLQELWLRLYSLRVPAGAAINGHSPAGGALLASCCDYRAMIASDKYTIGLNEAKFGLVAPFWFVDSFLALVGQREAEFALLNGKLYHVDEAKKIGLIDVVVEDKQAAISRCQQVILGMNKCVPKAWYLTKLAMREAPLERLKAKRRQDTDNFVSFVMTDSMQKYLEVYINSLGGKKSK